MKTNYNDLQTLTKRCLAEIIMPISSLDVRKSQSIIENFFNFVASELKQGRHLAIKGAGTMRLSVKGERPVRNPKNLEDFTLAKRAAVKLGVSHNSKLDLIKSTQIGCEELRTAIRENTHMTAMQSLLIHKKILEVIKEVAENRTRIEIRCFGTFFPVTKKAGIVRNPKTGDRVNMPERSFVKFKISKALREDIESGELFQSVI